MEGLSRRGGSHEFLEGLEEWQTEALGQLKPTPHPACRVLRCLQTFRHCSAAVLFEVARGLAEPLGSERERHQLGATGGRDAVPGYPENLRSATVLTADHYGSPFAPLGTCVVKRFSTNSRTRFDNSTTTDACQTIHGN